jgi:hypothetical protein
MKLIGGNFIVAVFMAIFMLFSAENSLAQTDRSLDTDIVRAPHVNFNLGTFVPLADLNSRFGTFATVGGSFGIKTESNTYWGIRATYLTGAEAQEPGLLQNLTSSANEIIDNEGDVAFIRVSGRGAIFGAHFGKVFPNALPLPNSNPNSGLFIRGGLGSIHHKIGYDFTENRITQLEDPYLQGYDRLTWGAYASGFLGYFHMATNKRINFYTGLWGFAAYTQPLRTINLDTGLSDQGPRLDAGLGLEFGWTLHIYKRSPKEYWY